MKNTKSGKKDQRLNRQEPPAIAAELPGSAGGLTVIPPLTEKLKWIGGLGIVLIVLICYLPALRNGFIWDDDQYVTENIALRSLAGLWSAWFKLGATPQYYPLVFSTFWIEYHLWGLHPFGYHLNNVLLHAGSAILLWIALRRLSVPGAWLAGLILAVHPVNVESVAWVTERKNTLSLFFYLLSFLSLMRVYGLDDGDINKKFARRPYFLGLAFFVCAMLSKTVACSLPVTFLIVLWWKRGKIRWSDLPPIVPFFIIGLALGLTTALMEKIHVGAVGKDWEISPLERCLIAGRILWFYLGKLAWPANLTFIYPRWQINSALWWQYLFPLGYLTLLSCLWFLRNKSRGPLAVFLIFAVTLFPALGFINVYPMRFSFVADHFQYLATLAPIALAAGLIVLGLNRLSPPLRSGGWLILAAIAGIFGSITWRQGYHYKDAITVWRDNVAANPSSWIAHLNLGILLSDMNKNTEAEVHYQEVVRLYTTPEFLGYLGNYYNRTKRWNEAIVYFQKALDIDPDYPDAQLNMAIALEALNRNNDSRDHFERAIICFKKYLDIDSSDPEWHCSLGTALLGAGHITEARAEYDTALKLNPDYFSAHVGLADLLTMQNQMAEAVIHLRRASHLAPHKIHVAEMLAWILATYPEDRLRDGKEAVRLAELACREAEFPEAQNLDTLGAAYAETGRFDEAIQAVQKAISLAQTAKDETLARSAAERLRLYQTHQPFREKLVLPNP